jgi:hypothetical protein
MLDNSELTGPRLIAWGRAVAEARVVDALGWSKMLENAR